VIEVVPLQRLAYSFGEFELQWTILPAADGCIPRLDHKGFDLSKPKHRFGFETMGPGGAVPCCLDWLRACRRCKWVREREPCPSPAQIMPRLVAGEESGYGPLAGC
jgi:hypothetical protein